MKRAILVPVLAISLVACATSSSTPDEDAASIVVVRSPATSVDRPAIAKLRTRDRIVSILASDDGPRVSLATLDGETLEQGLTIDELRTKDPGIYAVISSSVASIDASLDRKFLASPRADGDR